MQYESPPHPIEFSHLSVPERIFMAEALWDSVYDEADNLPISEEIKQELDRRLAAEKEGKVTFSSWEDVKARLFKKI